MVLSALCTVSDLILIRIERQLASSSDFVDEKMCGGGRAELSVGRGGPVCLSGLPRLCAGEGQEGVIW